MPLARHPRLRRSSAVGRFAAAAAAEALGDEKETRVREGTLRLGAVFAFMNGCVTFSHRFYREVLENPRTASPILFPETVFNAPSSHLSAVFGSTSQNYTLVGDSAQFLPGMEVAIGWLLAGEVDACLVVGAEELDWLSTEACMLFSRRCVISEGAGALLLERTSVETGSGTIEVAAITDAHMFTNTQSKQDAAHRMRADLPARPADSVLVDGCGCVSGSNVENVAWTDWQSERLSPAAVVGDALGAGLALQCVAAAGLLHRRVWREALVSAVGTNQQAVGAHFRRLERDG